MKNKNRIEVKVDEKGWTSTLLDGELHSFNDRPSLVSYDGLDQTWHKNGKIHREGGKPAVIREHVTYASADSDVIIRHRIEQEWRTEGSIDRGLDLPGEINETREFDSNGVLAHESSTSKWYKNGKFHRDGDKPAYVYKERRLDLPPGEYSLVWEICFYKNNRQHRDGDKPSFVHSRHGFDNGEYYSYETINYKKHGSFHRGGDKPALTVFEFIDKELVSSQESYYLNGDCHRDGDKPANVDFDSFRKVTEYYHFGKLDRKTEPALIIETKSEKVISFYEKNEIFVNLYDAFSEFLLKRLVLVLPVEFGSVKVGDYPPSQLASILHTVTGISYKLDNEEKYLEQ